MQGETKERWMELCEKAAFEPDPEELLRLIEEINRLLEDRENRLQGQRSAFKASSA